MHVAEEKPVIIREPGTSLESQRVLWCVKYVQRSVALVSSANNNKSMER